MMASTTWQAAFPTLVVEGHALGALAVVRSLGRSGYPVHACAYRPDALALKSRYAAASVICPAYSDPGFVTWLREYVREHDIRAIVPSEGLLLAIRSAFDEFSPLLPVSHQEDVVYSGMSKFDQLKAMTTQSGCPGQIHCPPTLLIENLAVVPSPCQLHGLKYPLYIKVDACHSRSGTDGHVRRAFSQESLYEQLEQLSTSFKRGLVQGHVPGQGVGAFFLIWNGQVRAEFMHIRLHEVPHTGGISSLRASWWHEGIRNDALRKLQTMNWEGVAMMEYRWEADSDRFHFIEMNGRFWGSLHLALHSGIDFPRLLLDTFHGHPSELPEQPRARIRCRMTFPADAQYVWSRWKDRNLSLTARLWSVVEFFLLCLDPRVYSDLFFPGDRALYFMRLRDFILENGLSRSEAVRRPKVKQSSQGRHYNIVGGIMMIIPTVISS